MRDDFRVDLVDNKADLVATPKVDSVDKEVLEDSVDRDNSLVLEVVSVDHKDLVETLKVGLEDSAGKEVKDSVEDSQLNSHPNRMSSEDKDHNLDSEETVDSAEILREDSVDSRDLEATAKEVSEVNKADLEETHR